MALYPITVNTPVEALPHIYAEDDAAIYESISGGDGVYDIGEMLKATVLSNNNVRIGNGVLSVGGHIARIKYGDYEEMTIDNGESGKNRNDLIVARFSTTGLGGVDEFSLEVKKGVAVTGAAKDPEIETGNLYEGETIREFPLHRVRLEGISIVAVDQLFAVRKTNEQLQKEVDELNRKLKLRDYTEYQFKASDFTIPGGAGIISTWTAPETGYIEGFLRLSTYFSGSHDISAQLQSGNKVIQCIPTNISSASPEVSIKELSFRGYVVKETEYAIVTNDSNGGGSGLASSRLVYRYL